MWRLSVSQSRRGVGNASREAAKGAKKGDRIRGFWPLSRESGPEVRAFANPCACLAPFASSRLRVSQSRRGAGNASREAAKCAKKGDGSRRFCGRSRESGPEARAPANPCACLAPFASSRLRVSQSRRGAGNASREAAKCAKKGGRIRGFWPLSRESGPTARAPANPCACLPPPFASSRLRVFA
jgi:hypothetical protein